jgi:hypothetical protein
VQQAREAARRTQCRNNMKQLGLALHNYHDTYNRFPAAGYYAYWNGSAFVPRNFTWLTMILPYIDQAPLYNQINFSLPAYGQVPSHTDKQLPVFTCPSDTGVNPPGATANIAITSYSASLGYADDGNFAPSASGVFTANAHSNMKDLVDGTSTTISLTETCQAGYYCPVAGACVITCGTGKTRLNSGSPDKTPRAAFLALTYDPALASGNGFTFNGNSSPYPFPDGTAIPSSGGFFLNPAATANKMLGPYYGYGAGYMADFSSAGSIHTQGGQILMTDGAVRWLSANVSYNIWAALNTRQGGEVIPEF